MSNFLTCVKLVSLMIFFKFRLIHRQTKDNLIFGHHTTVMSSPGQPNVSMMLCCSNQWLVDQKNHYNVDMVVGFMNKQLLITYEIVKSKTSPFLSNLWVQGENYLVEKFFHWIWTQTNGPILSKTINYKTFCQFFHQKIFRTLKFLHKMLEN